MPNNKYLTLDENGEILASETSDGVLDSGALATIDGKSVTIYADIMNEADPLGITVEKGGKLILKKTEGDSSVAEFESGALLELKDGASFCLLYTSPGIRCKPDARACPGNGKTRRGRTKPKPGNGNPGNPRV